MSSFPRPPAPPEGPRKRPLRALVLGTLLALLLAEALVRLTLPLEGPCYRLDPLLLHDAIPGSARLQRMPGPRFVAVRFNDAGLRGPAPDPWHSRPRILLLGDSLVLAGNTPEEETLRARLEQALEGRVEVLNAGRESYGPDQTLLWWQSQGRALKPECVVLVLCAHNDAGDLMRNQLFRLDEQGALRQTRPTLGAPLLARFEARAAEAERLGLLQLLDLLTKETPAEIPARELVRAAMGAAAEQAEAHQRGTLLVEDLERDTYDADLALVADAPSRGHKLALLLALLREYQRSFDEEGVELLLALVPSAIDLLEGHPLRPDLADWPEYDPSRLAATLEEAATQAGLPLLSLGGALCELGPSAFEAGEDFHWSSRGQARAAELLAARLRPLLGTRAEGRD